ncbi:Hydroxysteroid dehydrogenase 1 [Rhynchospora pubera]|uniref:Hydroxysteroid dehydrogenase 1 n=1 Tax=Rhynchospora pubera TaxID=906938 RepID=A0AAV8HHP5_9POAL|nr:Hydroxysteroid dehydrogenase 1 [Rhynchospora pubera]
MTNFKVLMDVNFWGSVYPTYFAIPHLKASKGRVVVMSSMAGYTFVPRMSFYSASKGALISFYDTLRMEFGNEIAISIIAPGVIESEMTKGKVFTTEGKMQVDQELRDAMLGLVPVQPAKDFAKAVVGRVCTGARYIIEPKWWYGLYFHRVFIPEIVDYWQRLLYSVSPQVPATRSLSKRMLYSPIKRILYAQSIQSPEIKRE